jgi:AmmeMemoRadiSam system protein A
VVGYGALTILASGKGGLGMTTKRLLIHVARESAAASLSDRRPNLPLEGDVPPEGKVPCGAFVTLRSKGGELRGCIGSYNLDGSQPLYEVISSMAVSATRDSRFRSNPVTSEELKSRILLEISVLSPFERVADPGRIILGVHGVSLVWDGRRKSVYLPQVATETGWGLEKFLERLCLKGGLPRDAWKDRERMRFDLFTAEVFHE